MHDDVLKRLWQEQRLDLPALPDERQIAMIKRKMKDFNRIIFWRDFQESVVAIFLVIGFGVAFFYVSTLLARIGCVIIVLASTFVGWYLFHRKRRAARVDLDATIIQTLQYELRKIEAQIELLRSVLWWYILPLSIGAVVFYFGLQSLLLSRVVFLLFMMALNTWIYRLNQRAVEKTLLPLKHEVKTLLNFGGQETML